jgi:hypothetical protein
VRDSTELDENLLDDASDVLDEVDIPKAQHAIALRLEPFGAFAILVLALRMLAAIELDDEPR